ncbi:MAG: Maf family protein [Chloroflexi bacterium]|nr:Maf family protein [Chloroflexota bacterium]
MRIILASSSPRRQQLLRELGLPFAVVKPDIDESRGDDESLLDYVKRLSLEKAEAEAVTLEDSAALVIAADTIVIDHEGDLLGKPADAAEARRMLRRLRNREHAVVTAFTILRTGDRPRAISGCVRTAVTMRDYSDEEIETYIASGDPFDKAGGYAIQNKSFKPVARIEGSYSNVVGLPLDELQQSLSEFDVFSAPRV